MKRQANACRLLTPGPVSIEASVLEAMTCCPSPADAAFISMMEDVRRRLLRVAGMRPAEYAAVLTAGPCAFALEAALTTLIPEESRVLVVCNGAASIDVLVSGADCGLQGVSGLSFVLARRSILESSSVPSAPARSLIQRPVRLLHAVRSAEPSALSVPLAKLRRLLLRRLLHRPLLLRSLNPFLSKRWNPSRPA